MNKIKANITKFMQIKQKLAPKEIEKLDNPYSSLFFILRGKFKDRMIPDLTPGKINLLNIENLNPEERKKIFEFDAKNITEEIQKEKKTPRKYVKKSTKELKDNKLAKEKKNEINEDKMEVEENKDQENFNNQNISSSIKMSKNKKDKFNIYDETNVVDYNESSSEEENEGNDMADKNQNNTEKQNCDNNVENNSDYSKNCKICIELSEKDSESMDEKENVKEQKNERNNSNDIMMDVKLLEKKRKEDKNEDNIEKKSAIFSKFSKTSICKSFTPNKKFVVNDDDEDDVVMENNEKNNTENIINDKDNNNNNKETIVSNDGRKFTLYLDCETKTKGPKVSNFAEIIKKNNKNKINKNGALNEVNKDIINRDNYDILCLNNIKKILIEMKDKLSIKDEEKIGISQTLNNIDDIKKIYDKLSRKKKTYINLLNILKNIFAKITQISNYINFSSYIIKISENIHAFMKNMKKFDNSIFDILSYKKKKMAFKYIYSKLELKINSNHNQKLNEGKDKNKDNNNTSNNIKIIKILERYRKNSIVINDESKKFMEDIDSSKNIELSSNLKKKYEFLIANIKTSPHFMNYKSIFNHSSLVLSMFYDYKKLKDQIEAYKNKNTNKINISNSKKKK